MPSRSPGAGGDFGATGIRDLVDGLATVDGLGDQSLLLELGEARIDRAGARRVGAAGAVRERLHDVVAVPRTLVEEAQQVEAQVAVREDGCHHHSSSASAAACALAGGVCGCSARGAAP